MKKIWDWLLAVYGRFVALIEKIRRDRLYHFIAGFLFAALFGITFGLRAWSFFVAAGVGIAKECIDRFVQGEEFDWIDLAATALGGAFTALCFLLS